MSGEVKDGDEEMIKQSEIARRGKQVINSEIAKKVQPLLFHCFYFFKKFKEESLGQNGHRSLRGTIYYTTALKVLTKEYILGEP